MEKIVNCKADFKQQNYENLFDRDVQIKIKLIFLFLNIETFLFLFVCFLYIICFITFFSFPPPLSVLYDYFFTTCMIRLFSFSRQIYMHRLQEIKCLDFMKINLDKRKLNILRYKPRVYCKIIGLLL